MRLYFAILLLLLTACLGLKVRGQIVPDAGPAASQTGNTVTKVQVTNPITMDLEIQQIRLSHLPSFRYHYDDYLQYSPAVLMVGLKAFGYKGRTGWGRMLVSDAFSAGIMAGVVNALKYSVKRMRPDGSSANSFPSGHTATAFMAATMLHKEYGWRSHWFSVGGYTVATVIGISRVLNNRHWMTDVLTGGAIGVGSVHLGYFLSDLIFKDKYLIDGYVHPDPLSFDPHHKYYEAGFWFSRRFVVGNASDKEAGLLPSSGSSAGLSVMIPLIPRSGLAVRGGINQLGFRNIKSDKAYTTVHSDLKSVNMYNVLVGGFWVYPFPKIVEFDLKALIGYDWNPFGNGIDFVAQAAVAIRAGEFFRIKAFAEFETFYLSQQKPFANSFSIGFTSSFCW